MIPDPHNPNLVKLARKVFRYDEVLTDWGWTHDIYYDKPSATFLIIDFPKDGDTFELSIIPELGTGRMVSKGVEYRVRVFED